ncbi:MAG: PilZ domain-containing protein [Thermodesulfobacteriota bacterium]
MGRKRSDRPDNKREMMRVPFETSVTLLINGKEFPVTASRDISLKGIYVQAKGVTAGTTCAVIITLTGSDPKITINFDGCVVRVDDSGAGILITSIGMEDFTHLQNLVASNAGDYDTIHEEFVKRKDPPGTR